MKHEWQFYGVVVLFLDILSIILSNVLSVWFRFNPAFFKDMQATDQPGDGYYTILLIIIPIFITVNAAFKLYRTEPDLNTYKNLGKTIVSGLLSALILMSFTFITKRGLDYSRFVLVFFIALQLVISNVFRGGFRYYIRGRYKKGYVRKKIAIIGTGSLAEAYINSIKNYATWGYKVEGVILPEEGERQTGFMGYRVLGNAGDLADLNKRYNFDEIIVALHFNETPLIKKIVKVCDLDGIRVKIVPVYYEYLSAGVSMEDIHGLSMMVIRSIPLDAAPNRFIKRVFDIVCSALLILISSPILLMVALGIKVTSPGPILFKQERVGLNNRKFNILKFRSMKVQNDEEEISQWTTKEDPRKTKFGSFIRKFNLDELPQFFNTLMGDMSIVGPRPERPYWVEKFKDEIPEYMLRHYVKSGITGWAQVNGWRGDTSIEERIKCDNHYIKNWSLWLDIKICLLTVVKAFRDQNAY